MDSDNILEGSRVVVSNNAHESSLLRMLVEGAISDPPLPRLIDHGRFIRSGNQEHGIAGSFGISRSRTTRPPTSIPNSTHRVSFESTLEDYFKEEHRDSLISAIIGSFKLKDLFHQGRLLLTTDPFSNKCSTI